MVAGHKVELGGCGNNTHAADAAAAIKAEATVLEPGRRRKLAEYALTLTEGFHSNDNVAVEGRWLHAAAGQRFLCGILCLASLPWVSHASGHSHHQQAITSCSINVLNDVVVDTSAERPATGCTSSRSAAVSRAQTHTPQTQ